MKKLYVIVETIPTLQATALPNVYGNAKGQPFGTRENAQRALTMRKLKNACIKEIQR